MKTAGGYVGFLGGGVFFLYRFSAFRASFRALVGGNSNSSIKACTNLLSPVWEVLFFATTVE